jgi:hypothetical protein
MSSKARVATVHALPGRGQGHAGGVCELASDPRGSTTALLDVLLLSAIRADILRERDLITRETVRALHARGERHLVLVT